MKDKLVFFVYIIIFVIFLTLLKMNPVILGLAGALPALAGAALSFTGKSWVRPLLITYGALIFVTAAVFAANFFMHFFETDNIFAVLLLIPLPIGSVIIAIAQAVCRLKAKKA